MAEGNEAKVLVSTAEAQGSEAPEVDHSKEAPQHYALAEGLQIHYGDKAGLEPTPIRNNAEPASISIPAQQLRSKPILIFGIILSCIIVLAVALGVGLGVGLPHRESSSPSESSTSTLPTASSPASTSPPLPKHGALYDTSLAAVTSSDGNKHVFFQDFNQSIRHVVFSKSVGGWSDSDFVDGTSSARNETPLAAIAVNATVTTVINLFYIDNQNLLRAVNYFPTGGNQFGSRIPPNPMSNTSLVTAAASRTLSVASLPPSSHILQAILAYEAPNGNLTMLYGSTLNDTFTIQWTWQNITAPFYSVFDNQTILPSPPIGFSVDDTLGPNTLTAFSFFNLNAVSNTSACPLYTTTLSNYTELLKPVPDSRGFVSEPAFYGGDNQNSPTRPSIPNNATDAVRDSDIISFFTFSNSSGSAGYGAGSIAFVQNQTLIVGLNDPNGLPGLSTPYPFPRLAWLNSSAQSATYIYHQQDDSVIVEDALVIGGNWHTTKINIGTSN